MAKTDIIDITVDSFKGGFVNRGDPDTLRLDEAQVFDNISFYGNGSFGSRRGISRIATSISGVTEVTGLVPLIKRDGSHKLIMTYDDKVVYWDESGDVWSSAITTRATSGKHTAGVSYDDYVWLTNKGTGVNDRYARYDGTTYTTYASNPQGNMMALHRNRVCVAGVDSALTSVYYSALGDLTDFTFSSPRVASEGGVVSFHEFGDSVTALVTRDQGKDLNSAVYVMKESSTWALDWQTVTLATGTVEDFPVRTLIKNNHGASYARAAYFENNNIISANDVQKEVRQLGYEADFTDQRTNELTRMLRNTMQYYNFDEAASIWWDKKWLVACKTSDASFNNRVIVLDGDYQEQGRPVPTSIFDWPVNVWSIYKNNLYFGASDEGAVYQAFTGDHDENAAIAARYQSGNLDFGAPNRQKVCKEIYITGYITQVGELTFKAFHDFNGSESWSVTINGQGDYVDGNIVASLGVHAMGSTPPLGGGSGGNQDTEYKKFYIRIETERIRFFRQKLEISSDTAGGAWIVNNITYSVQGINKKVVPTAHVLPQ